MKKICLPVFLLIFLILLFILTFETREFSSKEQVEFFVDKPYLSLIKELSAKNSLEKIAEENNSRIVNKSWRRFDIKVPRKLLNVAQYELDAVLVFEIEKSDPYLGSLNLPFTQKVKVTNKEFTVDTDLRDFQKNIMSCKKFINIKPNPKGLNTIVQVESELSIKLKAPFFLKNKINKKVKENNLNEIENIKNNIIKNSGTVFTITIK